MIYNNNNNYYYYYYEFIQRFFSRIQKRSLQRSTNSNKNEKNKILCAIQIKKNYFKNI